MSRSRSTFAEYAANNSPFSQFTVDNTVSTNSNHAYNSFLSTCPRGLSTTVTTTAYTQPLAVANAFPLSLPIVTPNSDLTSFKLTPPQLSLPIFTSDVQLKRTSNNAYDNFMSERPVITKSIPMPDSLATASNTAIKQFGLRAVDNVIEGSRGYLGAKLRVTGLVIDVYDRTNSAASTGLDAAPSFVCASLAGVSKTITATVGYGTVVTEGLLVAGTSGGLGLIPATLFVSAALPVVDMVSNVVGDSVEMACHHIANSLQPYVGETDAEKHIRSSFGRAKTAEQEQLFKFTLDTIKKSDPVDLSGCDIATLTKRVESVNSLKSMIQSMQVSGLKTSDAEAGDLILEISVIERKLNSVVRECVLNRSNHSAVSSNPSALFTTGGDRSIASSHIVPNIPKL